MKACEGGLLDRVLPDYFAVFGAEVLFDKLEHCSQLGLASEWGTFYFSFYVSKFGQRSDCLIVTLGLLAGIDHAVHQGKSLFQE